MSSAGTGRISNGKRKQDNLIWEVRKVPRKVLAKQDEEQQGGRRRRGIRMVMENIDQESEVQSKQNSFDNGNEYQQKQLFAPENLQDQLVKKGYQKALDNIFKTSFSNKQDDVFAPPRAWLIEEVGQTSRTLFTQHDDQANKKQVEFKVQDGVERQQVVEIRKYGLFYDIEEVGKGYQKSTDQIENKRKLDEEGQQQLQVKRQKVVDLSDKEKQQLAALLAESSGVPFEDEYVEQPVIAQEILIGEVVHVGQKQLHVHDDVIMEEGEEPPETP
eukprot:TRINITY_DN17566_c2_g1_i1.p1 TRINITY_DN17566_c2_g1~~TRINITY_DN17566_c2_g1_i1.p1  ORF type:complete len:273 (+),score=47.81 TRINITY_DN17566_c2_g1_i1:202-1020(+)